ncbi:MAG: hypothetical protein WA667_01980 [Candidatus Nitrosopolaris sp.]
MDNLPSVSPDTHGIDEEDRNEDQDLEEEGKKEGDTAIRLASRDTDRIDKDSKGETEEESFVGRTSDQIAKYVGVSGATIERVKTIIELGSEEQIASLRDKSQRGGGGVDTGTWEKGGGGAADATTTTSATTTIAAGELKLASELILRLSPLSVSHSWAKES